MIAAHQIDVQARYYEHIALAERVQTTNNAIKALELGDAVDFSRFKHGLRTAQYARHVRKQILRELVTHSSAEAEKVWGEVAPDVARGRRGKWCERSRQGGRHFKDLNAKG